MRYERSPSVESAHTCPDVKGMTAWLEPVGLNHGRRLGEAARQQSRIVGVTSKRDGLAAFFSPPANDGRVERHRRIDLQGPAIDSKHAQSLTELLFERVRIE